MAAVIYFHWTAAGYDLIRLQHNYLIIGGDGRVRYNNYGPVIWCGIGERWDLLKLEKDGPSNGGSAASTC